MEDEKKKTVRQCLLEMRDNFVETVAGGVLDFKRHVEIREKDPNYSRTDKLGRQVGIDTLIESYKLSVENAQEYIKEIDKLLEKVKKDEDYLPEVEAMLKWVKPVIVKPAPAFRAKVEPNNKLGIAEK